jgi:transglutaminase/protease-like cytokinesis protein 3
MTRFSEFDLATELGIDLHDLWDERFSGVKHEALMQEHEQRVADWNTIQAMRAFQGTLNEIGQIHREKEALRRARISATKQAKEYDFPNELLQIAIRSLDAGGAV